MLGGYYGHGKVEESLKLFQEIMEQDLVPNQVAFLSPLSACSHGSIVGRDRRTYHKSPHIKNNLELCRTLLKDGPTLVLPSNAYAASGRWDEIGSIRRNMRVLTVEKNTVLSWIEAKKDIHVFYSGEQSHPKVMRCKLSCID
ncbi:hypothetical protein Lal_00026096 [Lupinus albus]|nr:hypothetical protein Lal_00026096 [Lupinus albus]